MTQVTNDHFLLSDPALKVLRINKMIYLGNRLQNFPILQRSE